MQVYKGNLLAVIYSTTLLLLSSCDMQGASFTRSACIAGWHSQVAVMKTIENTLLENAGVLDDYIVVKIGSEGYSVFGFYLFALGEDAGLMLKYLVGDEAITITALSRSVAGEIWNSGFSRALQDIGNEFGGINTNDPSCYFVRVNRDAISEDFTLIRGTDFENPSLVSLEQILGLFEGLSETAEGRVVVDRSMPNEAEINRIIDELKRNVFADVDRVIERSRRMESQEPGR